MLPQEIIQIKRNGGELSEQQLQGFFNGFLGGQVADYQMSAFLMACYFAGMSYAEAVASTRIFLESGSRIDLSSIPGAKVDKHSTGGVGDKTSLLVAPIVAAAGVRVPMISGRGLGHTGGTLDKLGSIPGFRVDLSNEEFAGIVRSAGMAMMGQSEDIVPVDRRVYALRDVTATVEILPLICASILSKKIAGGAGALVLDIKTGDGAFMTERGQAEELAEMITRVGAEFDLPVTGFITDMSEPLGLAVGNWLEVVEVVDCLQGRETPDLMEVTCALAGAMIHAGQKASSVAEGIEIAKDMLRRRLAFDRFVDLVRAQGGDTKYIEHTMSYRNAAEIMEVHAGDAGVITAVDARRIGQIASKLGAGRVRVGDEINPAAGIVLLKKTGDRVEEGEALCRLYTDRSDAGDLRYEAQSAFQIGVSAAAPESKLLSYFDIEGVRGSDEILAAKSGEMN